MIIMEDDGRYWCLWLRTNRRVKWQYAEWGGRWASLDEAIEQARIRAKGEFAEYRIENMITDEVKTGFHNKGDKQ